MLNYFPVIRLYLKWSAEGANKNHSGLQVGLEAFNASHKKGKLNDKPVFLTLWERTPISFQRKKFYLTNLRPYIYTRKWSSINALDTFGRRIVGSKVGRDTDYPNCRLSCFSPFLERNSAIIPRAGHARFLLDLSNSVYHFTIQSYTG